MSTYLLTWNPEKCNGMIFKMTSENLDVFSIRFYARSPGDPLPDRQTLDDLVVNLKRLLSEIPGMAITEEK